MLACLADRFARIDARSLGLFRIGMGLVLIGDLLHRWDWIEAFYSNDGVLPNHNHLFLLEDKGRVWSALHAFSSVGENHAAFVIILAIYLAFTLGWHTRAFHLLSLVALVSLVGRNTLLDSIGGSVAIALVGFSALLPLGLRFSLDSLRRSLRETVEQTPEELNQPLPSAPEAPRSLAALALVLVVGSIYLFVALQQTGGTWQDGTALYYALHVDRWTSRLGLSLRDSVGLTAALTRVVHFAPLAVLPLALVPVGRRFTRAAAIALMVVHGLVFVLLFHFGLYGWSLLAASALLVPAESWDRVKRGTRKRTLVYDDDCGICLWCARLVKRFDLRDNVVFAPNSRTDQLPERVTAEMTERSMVVLDEDGRPHTDADALSELLRSLPLLWPVGLAILFPGIRQLTRRAYLAIASRRMDVSVACGMAECGIAESEQAATADDPAAEQDPTPARAAWRLVGSVLANGLAVVLFAAFVAQSERNNELPVTTGLGHSEKLTALASWARLTAPWHLWAPDPPTHNGRLVVDAETKSGWVVDLLTGYPPDADLADPLHARRDSLWAAYTDRIHRSEYESFRQELRRYLNRGGFAVDARKPEHYIARLEAHWASVDIAPPGQSREAAVERVTIFGRSSPPPARPRPAPEGGRLRGLPPLRRPIER